MPHAPSAALDRRHRTIRHDLAARGLDALIVTSLPNILYLTNFSGSSAIVVITADRLHFVTDFRYVTTMNAARGTAGECPGLELVTVDGSYDVTLANLIASSGWRRIGFEAAHLTRGAPRMAEGDARRFVAVRGARRDRAHRRAGARPQGRVRDRDAARGGAAAVGGGGDGADAGPARRRRARPGPGHRLADP